MQFSTTGFVSGSQIEYFSGNKVGPTGIFNGMVRIKIPERRDAYGLNYTEVAPPQSLDGVDAIDLNRKGPYLYGYKDTSTRYFSGDFTLPNTYLYETCHGIRKSGMDLRNFYPAYYRYGYFENLWGPNPTRTVTLQNFQLVENVERRSLVESDQDRAKSFFGANGFQITLPEYHQLNGINPINCGGANPAGCNPTTSAIQHFRYLYYECPNDVAIKSPTYLEAEMKWVPGNGMRYVKGGTSDSAYLIGGGLYNNSPIPTVFDILGGYNLNDVCSGPKENNVYSSLTCPALDLESFTSNLKGSNPLLADYVANAVAGFGFGGLVGNGRGGYVAGPGAGAQDIGNEDWWYWHFAYKENSETFPFNNNPDRVTSDPTTKSIVNSDGSTTTTSTYKVRGSNASIQTFSSNIAQESWYWDHRLCPDFPKFLPWNRGASIFAHPETYFEVPYYSAIGKFGFYGIRFLNSLGSLVDNDGVFRSGCNSTLGSPFSRALAPVYGDSYCDRLLKTAASQRKYNDYYAGNRGLFLALNYDYLKEDKSFTGLSDLVKTGLLNLHHSLWSGLGYCTKGDATLLGAWVNDKPTLYQEKKYIDINTTGYLRGSIPDKYLYTNFLYDSTFLNESLIPNADKIFLNKYSKYIVQDTDANLNTGSYKFMSDHQQYISSKRAIGHEINGLPVDLYPLNRIYYSTDKVEDYTKNGRPLERLNTNNLKKIPKSYFQGYYALSSGAFPDVSLLTTYDYTGGSYGFNAGFYNKIDQFGTTPKRSYILSASGELLYNKSLNKSSLITGISLLGYHEIGKLDSNFSCFNPIFIQQPTDVVCKIGQTPTFRALAVDYHTIPEDKINGGRWPEINYWARKLKIIDNQSKLLYPVAYKWGRFPITEKANYTIGQLSGIEWASKTGEWCGLEHEYEPILTLIHPDRCDPKLTGYNGRITPGASKDFAQYIHGCQKGVDDQYMYFCMASGRFGIRRSEPVNLIIDNTLTLDLAFSNGSTSTFNPAIVFHSDDSYNRYTLTVLSAAKTNPYYGFGPDKNAIPETALAERRTPSAAGCLPSWAPCCDDNAKRGMAMIGYGSWNYTWQPPNIQDLPLLNSNWGRVVNYGGLVTFSGTLSQDQGDSLYGRVHLPKVMNGQYTSRYYMGIPFDVYLNKSVKVRHWSVEEAAWATDNTKQGIPFHSGDIPTALYPPSEGSVRYSSFPFKTADQYYGKGHWQFSNNLGLIKRLGYTDLLGKGPTWDGKDDKGQTLITFSSVLTDKEKLLGAIKASLKYCPGGNAGWRKSSIGRHMAYFVEGFSSFYIFCGNKKKEFVKNLSFVAPGLRVGNAGFQYAWIGQPNSAYLSRQTMPGPYAYFWKVNKHNRDKNGNGMPLGMYAYSTDGPYSMMYDLPAVYGLYLKSNKLDKNQAKIDKIKEIRKKMVSGQASYVRAGATVWTQRIEFNLSETPDKATHWCGSPFGNKGSACFDLEPVGDEPVEYCEYPNYTVDVASNPDLDIYECPTFGVDQNVCFPPCLSLRYDQGIVPGGKELDLFGGKKNEYQPQRIVSMAEYHGGANSQQSLGPCYTPWAKLLPGFLPSRLMPNLEKYQSIDPCYGGGSDHCNYVTPTVWLGSAQKGFSNISYMHSLFGSFS